MEKLLQWSIANANGDKETAEKVGAPDPKAIAELFGQMGPDEPTLMIQNMQVITHKDSTIENKEVAFDNFEMLIENLDNANNIENLKMWPTILDLLKSDNDVILSNTCSIIGTATQNNLKCQDDFFNNLTSFERLFEICRAENLGVKAKALYAVSNAIRHNEKGIKLFLNDDGVSLIEHLLKDDREKVQIRLNSLLNSLFSVKLENAHVQKLENVLGKEKVQQYINDN